jgi:RNA polymerase sigma-70 factor (ECF subfamily)
LPPGSGLSTTHPASSGGDAWFVPCEFGSRLGCLGAPKRSLAASQRTRLNKIRAVRLFESVRKKPPATVDDLERLYRQRFTAFLRVATAISGDAERGRDAVQSAFMSAVRHVDSFRGAGTLDAWVWAILVREARPTRAPTEGPLGEVIASAQGNPSDSEDATSIRRYIASLPLRQREAVFLRYFADLDYRTIARVLDVEPGTVSATLSAAHQTLRKRMEATTR